MIKQYINGRTITGNGGSIQVINPATEEIAGVVSCVDTEQVSDALEAAEAAFKKWSSLSHAERGKWILKLRDAIAAERETMLQLLMSETGKPLNNAAYDYEMLIDCLGYFHEEAKRLTGTIIDDLENKFRNLVIRQPLGVVVGYLAWNFPLLNVGYKLGPALASGCTCILKPSSRTPLATLYIGEVAEKIGFPAGVINILAGSGKEVAKVLNESSIPKMLTLIGSYLTGRSIIAQSATSIKHFSLELGGNAPAIVMPDADIEAAAKLIVSLKFSNTGQVCVSPNRVFVHENIHDDFIEYARHYTEAIKLGWGMEPAADMGPMISGEDRNRVKSLVSEALVCGGKAPQDKPKGYYFLPTLLDHASMDMRVCREEIFGPVMPVLTFKNRDEVIAEANNTEYGLAAYLFTGNIKDVFYISERLEFGSISINEPFYAVNLPHGGVKESGIGKDCSIYSLEEYYYLKRISIKID